jgi:glycine betaine catabolism B
MSLATSPTRPHLEYGVRISPSAFKRAFAALQPGNAVMVQGPLGHYILDTSRPAVLAAGGIGITQLKGMAEYAADRRLSIPVRLVYSNRTVDQIVYREELEALEQGNPNFRVLWTLTRPEPGSWTGWAGRVAGHSGTTLLVEAAEALDQTVYYFAPGFIQACFKSLVESGFSEADISSKSSAGMESPYDSNRNGAPSRAMSRAALGYLRQETGNQKAAHCGCTPGT